MLPLAHLGIGERLARWRAPSLPGKPVLLGCLLPDLLDKPLYYLPALLTGKRGAELGLLSGTRTVGHSLLFLALLFAIAALPGGRRRAWLGLAFGCAAHLFLDNFNEPFQPYTDYASRISLLFPAYGWRFPIAIHRTAGDHFLAHLSAWEIGGELLGIALLMKLWMKRRA